MPNTKSAAKRLRQNLAHRARNRSVKSAIRTQMRQVREAVKEGDVAKAAQQFRLAAKALDKAASKKVIHRNTAARLKSRLQNSIKSGKAASA
jgi:small subunit ribosomal protein S20